MKKEPEPWYAHQFPDRPLTEGALLCCCLLCAVSLERCGVEDAHRPIVFNTDTRSFTCQASYVAYFRKDEQLHDMLRYRGELGATWVTAVSIGRRHGRPAYSLDPDEQYPLPLDEWPVCIHCGPTSDKEAGAPKKAQLYLFRATPLRGVVRLAGVAAGSPTSIGMKSSRKRPNRLPRPGSR